MAGHRRRLTTVALAATVAVGGLLAFAAPASAHDFIVGSTPAEGETLTALPETFSVTANEPIVDFVGDGTGFGIQVTDAAGRFYGDGCISLVDSTMSMPATLGGAGDYTMVWQLISSDSHPVSGTVSFTWAPPAGAVPSDGAAKAPVCGETEAVPEPEMTTQAGEPSDAATAAPAPADATGTLLWLGGAALAIVAAIGVTLLLVRPKKMGDGGAPDRG
jgi:methionine-rich copper-binding protein CopC